MVRVAAATVPTKVIHLFPLWDRVHHLFVHNPVDGLIACFIAD